MAVTGATVLGRRPRVIAQQVEGESVLLDIDSGEYFSLNAVGGRVWELCDGTASLTDIVTAICAEFDVDADTAATDCSELLENMARAGLVVEP